MLIHTPLCLCVCFPWVCVCSHSGRLHRTNCISFCGLMLTRMAGWKPSSSRSRASCTCHHRASLWSGEPGQAMSRYRGYFKERKNLHRSLRAEWIPHWPTGCISHTEKNVNAWGSTADQVSSACVQERAVLPREGVGTALNVWSEQMYARGIIKQHLSTQLPPSLV